MIPLRIITLGIYLGGISASAATSPSAPPHELFGFLLNQNQAAFDHTLGEPFNTSARDGLAYRVYALPSGKESYLVAAFEKDAAVLLELTGKDYRGPTGFFDLTLGQDAAAVEAILVSCPS